jgi:hypothetical protein
MGHETTVRFMASDRLRLSKVQQPGMLLAGVAFASWFGWRRDFGHDLYGVDLRFEEAVDGVPWAECSFDHDRIPRRGGDQVAQLSVCKWLRGLEDENVWLIRLLDNQLRERTLSEYGEAHSGTALC